MFNRRSPAAVQSGQAGPQDSRWRARSRVRPGKNGTPSAVRSADHLARGLLLAVLSGWLHGACAATHIGSAETGIEASVGPDGSYQIAARDPPWRFSGTIGAPVTRIVAGRGRDLAGTYREIRFKYTTLSGDARAGAIRVYDYRPVVLFNSIFEAPAKNAEPFPNLSSYPRNLHHLGYRESESFGGFSFTELGADGPWVFFDDQANTFIFSPASHYMNAALALGPGGEFTSGIAATDEIPSGFSQMTALVIGPGINRTFETWGRFLTDLSGKVRPANDADVTLRYLGYWTDRGAQYYYHYENDLGYEGTLLGVRDDFRRLGIPLGYVQLDSWFYPKGRDARWSSDDEPSRGGVHLYEASRELFPDGLRAFQRRLGLPLVAHNRWIDRSSPYRQAYRMSGNVSIDPALWAKWMHELRASGVRTYEQDWLSGPALAERDLRAGEIFMDQMAEAAKKEGISLQYCMPLPRHFLQGTRYSNLLTVRTSGDRFERKQWKPFLFNGRLASALGEWPWTDVFMSSETFNLLLSNLSASMVGIGDAIGTFDRKSLLHAVRPDGVIVKPDDSIVPLDATYIEEAKGRHAPLVASARTDHGGIVASYVFAFSQAEGDQHMTISPSALGYKRPVYVYNYFERTGSHARPDETVSARVGATGTYWIIVPIGASGIGFLGDADKFASNGKARIAKLEDNGRLSARIIFAAGEDRISLHGVSSGVPEAHARRGSIKNLSYDRETHLFRFDVFARPGTSADIILRSKDPARRTGAHSRG